MANFYKPILALILIICFTSKGIQCSYLNDLSAADKQDLLYKLAPPNSIVNGTQNKVVAESKRIVAERIKNAIYAINVTVNNTVLALQMISNWTNVLNQVLSQVDLAGIQKVLNGVDMMSGPYNLSTMSPVQALGREIANVVYDALSIDRSPVFDFNTVQQFWDNFDKYIQSNPNFTAFISSINKTHINFAALALVVPKDVNSQIALYDRWVRFVLGYKNVYNDLYQIYTNGSFVLSTAQLNSLRPIIPYLRCQFLKSININDIATWVTTPGTSKDVLYRICECNPKIVMYAIKAFTSGQFGLNNDYKDLIGDYAVQLYYASGRNSTDEIFDILGPNLISLLPVTTFEYVLMRVDNITKIRNYFIKYNLNVTYPGLRPEVRQVIANAAAAYLKSKIFQWDSVDLQLIINTVIYDVSDDDFGTILEANNTFLLTFSLFDKISPNVWKGFCNKGMRYYNLLVKKFSLVPQGLDRIKPLLVCKKDCNFSALLNYANNNTQLFNYTKQLLASLPQDVQGTCKNALVNVLRPTISIKNLTVANFSDILANGAVPIDSIFSRQEVASINDSVVKALFQNLAQANLTVKTARTICSKVLSQSPSLSNLTNLIKGLPLDYIKNNISSTDAINNIQIIIQNSNELSQAQLEYFVRKIATSKSNVLAILNSGALKLIARLTLTQVQSFNILPADIVNTTIPDHLITYFYNQSSQGRNFTSFNATTVVNVTQTINSVKPSEIKNFTSDNRLDMIIAMCTNLPPNVKSVVRRALTDMIINEAIQRSSSIPSDIANTLEPFLTNIDAQILIEISPSILQEIAKLKTFLSIIKKVTALQVDVCSFSRQARRNFALTVYQALGSVPTLLSNDLNNLKWLAVHLPVEIIVKIDPQAFLDAMPIYFQGSPFQLNATESAMFGNYLENIRVTKGLNLTNFGVLAYYLPSTAFSSVSNAELVSFCNAGYRWFNSNKQKLFDEIRNCRAGLTTDDDNDMAARFKAFDTQCWNAAKQLNMQFGRKKRQATSFQCDSDFLTAASTTDLASITGQQLIDCLPELGSSKKGWTLDQLTVLANNVKSFYGSVANIPSDTIKLMGQLALGLSNSDLSSLNVNTLDALESLGLLDSWTPAQVTALIQNPTIYQNLLTDDTKIIAAFNIICGLSSSDVTSISTTVFQSVIPFIKDISLTNCSSLPYLYTKASTVYGASLWSPNTDTITTLGSIIAGISQTDFQTNMTPDLLNKITPTAFKLLPASLINTLTPDAISSLNKDQIDAVLSSPQASQLTPTLLNTLRTQSTGTGENPYQAQTTTTTTTQPITQAQTTKKSSGLSITQGSSHLIMIIIAGLASILMF